MLYISFLHQTTTFNGRTFALMNCFISLFYIKPQLAGNVFSSIQDCFISLFYIKPQLSRPVADSLIYCFISLFYIKPQQPVLLYELGDDCFISLFYIKPQRCAPLGIPSGIALYLFSTSNHNSYSILLPSTRLLYISFLHQTTTINLIFYVNIYCFISLFYIKPQLVLRIERLGEIALYLFSTSNHNLMRVLSWSSELLYISFLHQTTTVQTATVHDGALLYISFLHQTTTTVCALPSEL